MFYSCRKLNAYSENIRLNTCTVNSCCPTHATKLKDLGLDACIQTRGFGFLNNYFIAASKLTHSGFDAALKPEN